MQDPAHDLARIAARALKLVVKPADTDVEVRDLNVYDRVTGAA
jgi:hypothetical protein